MKRPLRILHVHSGNLHGGVETMMLAIARNSDSCPEMKSSFALCFRGRLSGELEEAGAEIFDLGETQVRRPASIWRARKSLEQLLQEHRFDVVVTHSPWSNALFGGVVRSMRRPLAAFIHGTASGRHWLERWAKLTPPDLAICNSRFTAESLQYLYPKTPFEVLNPMVSIPSHSIGALRNQARAEFGVEETTTVIIQVSRMEAWKGHALHLRALGHLRQTPNWVCWQVGGAHRPAENRYLEKTKSLAAQLGIDDRLHFLGERTDVPRLLAAADIHCQPNAGPEPFGMTFIEALLAGLPVVTTAIGGAKEIIDETCGILTPPGDEIALAKSLQRLIEDPSLRQQLSSAGPARARRLSDPIIQLQRFHKILDSI